MKIRVIIASLACLAAASVGLQAQAPKATEPTKAADTAKGPDTAKEPETELGKHMDKMGAAYRRLNRQIEDATKNADSLTLIATIKTNAEAAMKLDPVKKGDLPADAQAKFVTDYKAKMKAFLVNVGKLEAAVKAGNNAEAKTLMATLKQDQKEGHTEFQKKKKKA